MVIISWLQRNNSYTNSSMSNLLEQEALRTFLCVGFATFLFEIFDVILE